MRNGNFKVQLIKHFSKYGYDYYSFRQLAESFLHCDYLPAKARNLGRDKLNAIEKEIQHTLFSIGKIDKLPNGQYVITKNPNKNDTKKTFCGEQIIYRYNDVGITIFWKSDKNLKGANCVTFFNRNNVRLLLNYYDNSNPDDYWGTTKQ